MILFSCVVFVFAEIQSQPRIKTPCTKNPDLYRFEHIGIEQGLSQNSIYAIHQDKFGFMWFGTEDGLNRYDGYKFATYRHDPSNPHSLSANFIQALLEDRNGALWVGTELGGLHRYIPESEGFVRYRANPNNKQTLTHNSIRALAEAPDGTIWVGTAFGLNAFHPITGIVKQYLPASQPIPLEQTIGFALPAPQVNAVAVDVQGNVWAGTFGGGVGKLNVKTGEWTYFRHNPRQSSSLSNDFVGTILVDSLGMIWIGTNHGLNLLNPTNGIMTSFLPNGANPASLQGVQVRGLWQENAHTLWIATNDGGISILNSTTGQCTNLHAEQTNALSLNTNIINRIYRDKAGTVWVGTGGSGINKFDPRAWKFVSYRHEINNFNSLVHNVVRGFHEDNDGTLWIATEGGLNKLNLQSGIFTAFTHNPTNPNSLAGNIVRSVYRDTKGRLWIGSASGLQYLDDKRGAFMTVPVAANNPNALPVNSIRTVLENADGTMWVATEGGGVCLYNPEQKRIRTFANDPANPRSLSNNAVVSLYRDRKGTLWVGTLNGLNRFDAQTQDFTRFIRDEANPQSLNSNNIRSMYEDVKGRFWIGTWGGGLHLFDRETGYCEVFRERDGLPNDAVYGILPDKQGYLWLTTNRGLARFHPDERSFRVYDADDGLQSNEFNGGAYSVGASGRLYVGGVQGFSAFFPDSIKDNDVMPQVVITGFKKFNKSVHVGKDIRNNAEITLRYDDKFFAIEFAALNFTHSRKNTYLYKLEGFDKAWIDAGTSREAAYTNLDAGNYVFRVKAGNNDGCWNEEGAKLSITILPPWWMTLWFRVAVALSLVSTGGVWFWSRLRRVEFQKQELERLVQVRTQELSSTNTSLKEANHEIEQHIQTVSEQAWEIATINTQLHARNEELETLNREKDEFLGIAAHDLKNPLTSIVLTTEMLQYNMGKMPPERVNERLQQIEATAMRMRDIVSDILDINALESGKLKLRMDACDAGMLAEEVVAEYTERATEKGITLHLDYDRAVIEQHFIHADYRKSREVLENLVSNAIKYSPHGKNIWVKLKYEEGNIQSLNGSDAASFLGSQPSSFLQFSVTDEGPGLSEEDKSRLFQRFTRLSAQPTGGEHSSGLGLSIAKKLIEAMNGEIWCESELGRGATFFVKFGCAASDESYSSLVAEDVINAGV
jgi:signal transduction histidine kinase/ligand-binding sensor domain-containing protein